jgi:hypothetical protein
MMHPYKYYQQFPQKINPFPEPREFKAISRNDLDDDGNLTDAENNDTDLDSESFKGTINNNIEEKMDSKTLHPLNSEEPEEMLLEDEEEDLIENESEQKSLIFL